MDKGFLKLFGDLCYEDSDSLIVSTQMLRNNTKLYFGKGMKDVTMMF